MMKHTRVLQLATEALLSSASIKLVNSRGYYIAPRERYSVGTLYLYTDGSLRDGVDSTDNDASAFWPSQEKAEAFLNKWRKSEIEKLNQQLLDAISAL